LSVTGQRAARHGAQLLHRIHRGVAHHRAEIPGGHIVDVQAVERHVVLVNAGAGDGSIAGGAWLDGEQRRRRIADLNRKLVHHLHFVVVAHSRVGGIQRDAFIGRRHFDSLDRAAHREAAVLGTGGVHVQVHVGDHRRSEPIAGEGDAVSRSRRHVHDRVGPDRVGLRCIGEVGRGIQQDDPCSWNDRTRGVGDDSGDRGNILRLDDGSCN